MSTLTGYNMRGQNEPSSSREDKLELKKKRGHMTDRFEGFVGIIYHLQKIIEKIKKGKMKEFGLSGNHVMCLFYLAQYPEGLTAARLCQLISVDKAATSRTLSELVEKGYVYYPNIEGQKRYRIPAALTEKGVEVTEKIDDIICKMVEEVRSGLSEEETRNMYHALNTISANLEKLVKNM